ncbi:MAG: DegQ family serine endoprotease [Gammaproteobacteria bacterium]|nr:DegQ family serine endoprotease [Gammaproteobacteria bacterium]
MHTRLKFPLLLIFILQSFSAFAGLPLQDGNGNTLPSLAPILQKINPAVVNIATYSTRQAYNPLLNDPFFRHFFARPEQQQPTQKTPQKKQQSAGSGVIVDAKAGSIMTNYHVIKGADEVEVSLVDGRTYKAKVVGTDPELDIAVLTIDAKDLKEVSLSDSSNLRVGDFVIAIGNPFGLGQTVTTGIVSALDRTGLGIEGYENFIQTDASINPGNSGGALVNLRGELIGINTAIIAPAGGNVGIGFAIPINMAKASMQQILQHGKVKRGQIGISIQDITPDLRKAFDLKNGQRGILVSSVSTGSPAEKAGLKEGDIIIAVDDKGTHSTGQLRSRIGAKNIGDKVQITVIRENKQKKFNINVGEPSQIASLDSKMHKLLDGATLEDNSKGKGVIVTALEPNSVAAYNGLRLGDTIIGVNRIRITSLHDFQTALKRDNEKILLHINRGGGSFYLVIR